MIWKAVFIFAALYVSSIQAAVYKCDIRGVTSFQQASCNTHQGAKRQDVPLPESESVRASELPADLRESYGLARRYCNDCQDGLCTRCSAFTRLSEKTALLRLGMTQLEVFTLLGEPTWVIMPADSGYWSIRDKRLVALEFHWQNATCNPVIAYLNANRKLIAWDTGRTQCFEKQRYTDLPPDHYRCDGGRQKICR